MKRSTQKALGLAASSVLLAGAFTSHVAAATDTWITTAGSQDWFTATNWSSNPTIPGSGDTALFNVTPPSSTVNINSNASVGAIFDDLNSTSAALTFGGTGTVSLFGQTLSVPQFTGTLTNQSNVVIAFGDPSGNAVSAANALTVNNSLALMNAQNVIVAPAFSGLPSASETLSLNGNITDGSATPAQMIFLGGGTSSNFGATFKLSGTVTNTGGIVVGNTAGTEGGVLSVTSPTALPTTGNIVINEQSQLLLSSEGGSYGAGTTLFLNGPGVGPGVSNGSSGAFRTNSTSGAANFTWAGGMNIGTDTTGSAASPFVVISITSSNSLTVSGQVTGSGGIQKQGGGNLIFSNSSNSWSGNLQIGNGAVTDTATSSISTGDLQFAQTGKNTPQVNLFNPNQNIQNLSSIFTGQTSGSFAQSLFLNGTNLTINATHNNTFGLGAAIGLVASIKDGNVSGVGSVVYNGQPGATLSLTGGNSYSGGTTITGGVLNLANVAVGSATGSGNVTVNSGGKLISGGGVLQFQAAQSVSNPVVTSGSMAGSLILNSGGIVSPGSDNLLGSLSVGALTAHTGSILDFDLIGGTTSTNDTLTSTGAATLDNGGTETVNIAGSKLAYGTYTLATYGSLANAGTQFTLGTTPAGHNRTYQLTTNPNNLVLTITDTGSEYYWSLGGGNPSVDGGGTWSVGSTNFFTSNPVVTQAPYPASSTSDVVIGNGGNGGTITLGSNVAVGGQLVFSTVNTPYTVAGTNTLTLTGGVIASNSATISAPVLLAGSQTFQAGAGQTLSVTGGISDGGHGYILTAGGDSGTVILGGTNNYSGGTIITQGAVQTSTQSLPASGGVQINNATSSLIFNQTSNGTYSGQISGPGSVVMNGTATATLGNSSNLYTGATVLEAGVLSVGSTGALGTGAGGINFVAPGGTLQFTSALNFPAGSPAQKINLVSGTGTIDTDGNDVTMGENLIGSGNLTKIGAGNLTFTGLVPTTVIGQLSILGGSVTFNGNASYGFAASSSPGTFTGDLILEGSLEVRLQSGDINGGGKVRIVSNGINFLNNGIAPSTVTIDNQIVLNETNISNFLTNIGANTGNTLAITGGISGNADVDFTGGKGVVILSGTGSTYTGATTIDNGTGGEIQLASNNVLPTSTNVHITNSGLLDVFGNVTQTIGSLDSGGGVGDVTTSPTNATVTNNSTNPGDLSTLIISGSKTTNFAGFITDSVNTPTPGGAVAIELGSSYTGTLVLNSATNNNYSGGTILNGGTLLLGTAGDALLGSQSGVISPITFGGGTLELSTSWAPSRPLTVNPGNSTISEENPGTSVNLSMPNINWHGGTLNLTNTGASTLAQNGGTISVTAGSTLAISSGSSLQVSGSTDPFTDGSDATKHVAIVNNGSLQFSNIFSSSIAGVTGTGTLTIGNGISHSTLQLASGSGASTQNALIVANNATLDITNNHMFITYGSGPDPISSIQALITEGFAGGNWAGQGITSSTAAANSLSYGVGYADSADPGNPAGLPSGTVEIKYTLLGDANLDGKVNGTDFAILATNFNQAVGGWDQGDFNYDHKANGSDFAFIATNFNQGASQADITALETFAAANGLLADVPEPASLGLLTLGAVSVLARRRRR